MKAKEIMAIIVVVMCCLFFWPMTANAKLVTIEIEAVVDSVDDDHGVLEGKIKTGDIITGWYSYDTSTPDSNPSISEGQYLHYIPPYGIFLSVGGFNFETDPANVDFLVEITNDYPPNDGYFLLSYSNIPLPSGVVVDYIFWHLYDPMGSALSTDALPTTPPVLDEWQFNHLLITGPSLGKSFGIEGHVISAIPGAFCGDPNHPYPVGDLNQDCRVDLLDLAILASHWMEDNRPSGVVKTVYWFLPDPNALVKSGGIRGGYQRSYSIQGRFELRIDFDSGTASFSHVDAKISEEVLFLDYNGAHITDNLDDLFHMTGLVSTDVNEAAISFVYERGIPTYPSADVHITVTFINDSIRLVGSVCEPAADGFCYYLDAIAIAVSEDP